VISKTGPLHLLPWNNGASYWYSLYERCRRTPDSIHLVKLETGLGEYGTKLGLGALVRVDKVEHYGMEKISILVANNPKKKKISLRLSKSNACGRVRNQDGQVYRRYQR
jgi:hypothetical protein